MAAVDSTNALPQRAPRGRRHAAAAAAAAVGATNKRSRAEEDTEDDRRRRTDATASAAAAERDGGSEAEVTVSWSAGSEKPPGEAADGQHCYECALARQSSSRVSGKSGNTDACVLWCVVWQTWTTRRTSSCTPVRLSPHS